MKNNLPKIDTNGSNCDTGARADRAADHLIPANENVGGTFKSGGTKTLRST